jgi:hypothetical protein
MVVDASAAITVVQGQVDEAVYGHRRVGDLDVKLRTVPHVRCRVTLVNR